MEVYENGELVGQIEDGEYKVIELDYGYRPMAIDATVQIKVHCEPAYLGGPPEIKAGTISMSGTTLGAVMALGYMAENILRNTPPGEKSKVARCIAAVVGEAFRYVLEP